MTKGTLLMCRNTHRSYAYEAPFDTTHCIVSTKEGEFLLVPNAAIMPDWDRIVIFKVKRLIVNISKNFI